MEAKEQPSNRRSKRWEKWKKILGTDAAIADVFLTGHISDDIDKLLKKLERDNSTDKKDDSAGHKDYRIQSVTDSSFPINLVTEIANRYAEQKSQRIVLSNLIWIEIIEHVFTELHCLNQGNKTEGNNKDMKEHRLALYRVLRKGMKHFSDFFEIEGQGRMNSEGVWDKILQSFPWYIDLSLLLDDSKTSTAIVALLETHIRKPQAKPKDAQRRDQDKLDYLFEWVRCLHESEWKRAKLFQSATPCPLGDLKSMSDSSGNTVLMLAARAESVQTFLYIFNYNYGEPKLLTDASKREEFQLHLLKETNKFKENFLHVLCKLPRRELMIENQIYTLFHNIPKNGPLSTCCEGLILSRDFLGKTILHQFFSQRRPEEKEEKEDLLSLLKSKDYQSQASKLLDEEDSSGYNVLLTALKNKNTGESSMSMLIQTLCAVNGGPITSAHLRNKNGIDIGHVLAAYGNLEADLKKFNTLLTKWNKPKEVQTTDASVSQQSGKKEIAKSQIYCGGEIGLNREDSINPPYKETQEREQETDMYMFGGPIKSSQIRLKNLTKSPRHCPSEAICTEFEVLLREESGKGENIVLRQGDSDAELEFGGWNAMHFACRYGNVENIIYLLKMGFKLTSQWKNGGQLALQAGEQEKLKEALYMSGTKNWLSQYVASVDPISSAFDHISEEDANSRLKARDPILRAEEMYVERALKLEQFVSDSIHWLKLNKRHQWKEWDRRIRHYLHILNCGESVETYLYLCLQLDSAELYKCLINSNYWKNAVKTMSIEEIEDSTVRYIMGKREFEDRWTKNLVLAKKIKKFREDATTYLQATTISAKLEHSDYVELTITEDYDDEVAVCCKGCYMLPVCCKKCCAGKATKGRSQILKYMKNGVIFLAYSQKKTDILERYSLIGLALLTGRIEMVKCLLMTRQYDLIPTALQIVIQADKLISFGDSHQNPILVEIKTFAAHVILNAINTLYAGSDDTEACIFHYLEGQLEANRENSVSSKLTIKGEGKKMITGKEKDKQYYTGEYYRELSKDNNADLLQDTCDIRKKTVDFYARKQGYWPNDASLVCEKAPTGPYYQHHLRNGAEFKFRDDRRAMKWLMLDINRLPMYNVLELAKKSHIKAIFSTNCFLKLAEKLWLQPVAVVASQTREDEEQLKSCCDRPLNWRNIFCPMGIHIIHMLGYLFYLAIFMEYILRASYKFGWEQVLLCVYIFSFFVQELYEVFNEINTIGSGITHYIKNVWNIYDWSLIIFTTAGIAIAATIGFDLRRSELTTQSEIDAFLNSGNVLLQVYNSKMVLGFGFVFSALRLLSHLRYFASTGGSLAIMQYIVVYDIMPFVLILAIIIGAFGTYFYTMLTIGGYEFYQNQTFQGDRDKLTLVEVYSRPILAMFGGFDLDNARRCKEARLTEKFGQGCAFEQGANVYIYCGIFFFVIIVNLVMVNMLIARFSATVDRKSKRSMIDWINNRFNLLCEYRTASPLPPPFNLFFYGPMALYYIYRQNKTRQEANTRAKAKERAKTAVANKKAETAYVNKRENTANALYQTQTNESPNEKQYKYKSTLEKFFAIQAERFSGKRAQLYRNPCLVYEDNDDEEDAEQTSVYIDFKKLDYQEDEASHESQDIRNRPPSGRSKSALVRSKTMHKE